VWVDGSAWPAGLSALQRAGERARHPIGRRGVAADDVHGDGREAAQLIPERHVEREAAGGALERLPVLCLLSEHRDGKPVSVGHEALGRPHPRRHARHRLVGAVCDDALRLQ
jgi:hypothetical protein